MKLDIENKILIPFMTLAILPIIILGIVSYWNGYQLLLNDKTQHLESSLIESIAYIETINEDVDNNLLTLQQAKIKALKYFQDIKKEESMIILEGDECLFNNTQFDINQIERIISTDVKNVVNKNESHLLFVHDAFDEWNWTIILGIDKSIFSDELLRIQKYIVLIAVIFLVISMQAIIFIAHSISKPIKKFAEICKKIEIDNLKEKININRSDEIGILANSFNNMIDQLNTSTEELIRIKKFNEDILKNIYIGIMTTDKNGHLLTINETGNAVLNQYNNSNDILDALNQQIHKTIKEKRNINRVISLNGVIKGKTIYFDVSTSLLRIENNEINGAICSFNDITRRKTLENNIVRVDRLASVGQFAAGLAHEIRNPLTGIKTSIQVIKNRITGNNEDSSIELIDGMSYEIARINNLIAELLDFSKPKKTNQEKADIIDILQKSLDLTKESMTRKGITVQMDNMTDNTTVLVDVGQAEQIFINIIANAIDAIDKAGYIHIKIEALMDKIPMILITFKDNGGGMDEDTIERIFDPFYTTKSKGTGLGLSVVSKLIEENNGKIEVESTKNVGTTFKVYLPLYLEDRNEN